MNKITGGSLAFDDVLIIPAFSDFQFNEIDTSVRLSPSIQLNMPIVSAGMDTVTESKMAIAIARCGGIGIIHRYMPAGTQAGEVDRVKRSEHGVISDPFSLSPNDYVHEASKLMAKYQISGVPIVELGKLVGIITNRDLRFSTDPGKKIYEIMTKDNLITAPEGTTMEEGKNILMKHKLEKLPLVDEKGSLKGLITVKDINKSIKYPNSAKDSQGRLLVGAAVGMTDDMMERAAALVNAKVDLLVLDALYGHTRNVVESIKKIKEAHPGVDLMAGNAATAEGALALIKAGANVIKVGFGPSSVSTARVVAGVGMPQITAILECAQAAGEYNVPVAADGGIRYSGDITKALAAGAHVCVMGNLFAGCEEAPGDAELFQGRKYKIYRGMESHTVKEWDAEYNPSAAPFISKGVEGRTTYKGEAADIVGQLKGGLTVGMMYCGCKNIAEMHEKARFVRVTGAGLRESHPHDIQITRESPNYTVL